MPSEDGLVTLAEIKEAREVLKKSPLKVVQTPLLKHVTPMYPQIDPSVDLYLKLENMQTTGSFKIRGVANQMSSLPPKVVSGDKKLITMSAGNYGKAFAYALNRLNLPGLCVMPLTAPSSRTELIKNMGCEILVIPSFEIEETLESYVKYDYYCLRPYSEKAYIAGCSSCALEILEECPEPDVVLVCCGGGGLVSGVAAGLKLSGRKKCRVYAVEPEGSRTMYESFRKREPVSMSVKSVAAGLSPPFAGKLTYQHCREFVEDVLLVSDNEILDTMRTFYNTGLVVEPSGCAAMAALIHGKVPDVKDKKVVVVVTGGNVTLSEMSSMLQP